MTKERTPVETEKKLHRSMISKDVLGGVIKGGLTGAAASAAAHRLGYSKAIKPGTAATLGGWLGGAYGDIKGHERTHKDVVGQERQHQKAEARMKRSSDGAAHGFFDTIKESGVLDTIGKGVIGGASSLAAKAGPKVGLTGMGLLHKATQAVGGAEKLHKIVGAGTLAAGGLAAGGLMAGRASR